MAQASLGIAKFEPLTAEPSAPPALSIAKFEPLAPAKPSRPVLELGGVTDPGSVKVGGVPQPIVPGNINLVKQPRVKNPDRTTSTVRSMSFERDGREILIPTVAADGSGILSNDDAIAQYDRTGKHLGIFADAASATQYAQQLHNDYAAGKYDDPAAKGTFNTKTGRYNEPPPLGEGILDTPLTGAKAITRGATTLASQLAHPAVLPADAHVIPPSAPGADDEALGAMADVLEGAAQAGSPLLIAGAILDLPGTALTLAASYLAGTAAYKASVYADATPQMQRFLTALAGTAVAVGGGKRIVDGLDAAAAATGKAARVVVLAGKLSGEAAGTARPVGKGGTLTEVAPKPGFHAPVDVIDPKEAWAVPADQGGETLTDMVRTAMAPEPPAVNVEQGRDRMVPVAPAPAAAAPLAIAKVEPLQGPGGDVVARIQTKIASGEPLGTDAARAAFAETQRVNAAREKAAEAIDVSPPKAERDEHSFSSTQINLPETTAAQLRAMADAIPDDEITGDGRAGDTPGTAPHVTVKYGLHTNDVEKVREVLKDEPPIVVTLGKTSLFSNDDADVVKVDVQSPDLHRINAAIADALETTDTHPTYVPHATIAYVKPGKGQQYAGDTRFEGHTATIDRITFSTKDGKIFEIPLTGAPKAAARAKPMTPQVPAMPGTAVSLPSFVTAPHAKKPETATTPARQAFIDLYLPKLQAAHNKEQYAWPIEDAPKVAAKMAEAIVRGTANLQSAALKATAKALGIKNTLREWQEWFLNQTTAPSARADVKPTTNPESRYAGEEAQPLIEATGREQTARWTQIALVRARLPKAPPPDQSRLQRTLDAQLTEYEGAYTELADAVGAEQASALRDTVEGRKVGEETDEGPTVPSDRAPLAGAPPADGEESRSERAPEPGAGVRRAPDRGDGEQPHPAGAGADAVAGTDAGRVGVPAERDGRAGAAERRPGGVADEAHDFVIAPGTELAAGGERTRIAGNLAAISTLKQIEGENRLATPDEQQVLAKYVGWGGLAAAFKENNSDYQRLKAALTDEEYRSARASTPNAHYTSPVVISAIYDALERLGVRGPMRVLEPAAGVGHFLGLMPPELTARASRSAVELDSISGRITRALYPSAKVQVVGFERAKLPTDHFDLIVSNVPFGNYQVSDKTFRGRPKSLTSAIHNYYFAKALDLVRPGGLVAFVTSRYTMDAQDQAVRRYLSGVARLVGAMRLPNTAFKANAGTEVVTDILFLQKGGDLNPDAWLRTVALENNHVNEYFTANPRMVLGRHASTGSMYRGDEYTVEPTGDLAEQMKAAIALLPAHVYTPPTTKAATPRVEDQIPSASVPYGVKSGSWFEQDGHLYTNENGEGVRHDLPPPEAQRVRGLLKVRDALRETMRTMLDTASTDAQVKAAQRTLNTTYDHFVQKHGWITKPKNYRALREDPDVFTMLALEEWAPKAEQPTKAAIFSRRTLKPSVPVEHVDTPKEALLVSLNELGHVNWARMASLTGQTEHELQLALEGLVYEDPQTGVWEATDRYLSGNVRAKLKAAQAAAAKNPKYALNVQALEQVQPADLEPADIAVRLGAPWVPPDVIDTFAQHLGLHGLTYRYSPGLAKWTVNNGRFYGSHSVQNTEQWGTQRRHGDDLLLSALNLGDPTVYDRVTNPDGSESSVVNQPETVAAREKQEAQAEEFKTWIWTDVERAKRLARLYNDTMNTMRLWEPDGSHLTLAGMSAGITLRPHQKNFIWRGLQQPNALAHHVVGAGKTFAGIALAMEKRRLGLARKPLVVVPNHLPVQWAKDVLKLYPAARVLASEKADFEPRNRRRFLNRIATGDWDVVIVPYSHFGRIPVADETFNEYVRSEIDALEKELKEARAEAGKNDPSVKELEKSKANLAAKLRDKKEGQAKDNTLTFEELGVDMLIVDEAHNYKRLGLITKMTRVAGIPAGRGSDRAFDLFVKSRYMGRSNPTGGVVFLTGTPISNTMAEMFVLMRYLAPAMLNARGIPQFDGWAATFGEKVTAFEISPTGRGFRSKTRFSRFTNLPELIQMYRSFADVQTADMLKLPTPKLKGGKAQTHVIPATTELDAYVETLLDRYEHVLGKKQPKPDPSEDNPLKITGDGRKAALDLRLVNIHQPEGGKVDVAGQQIYDIWKREATRKGTQLVFADLGTPSDDKAGRFTVYDALRDKLVALGIPRAEVKFIHQAKTPVQKDELFASVRAGHVRVLVGSTERMGAGTNVQDRLVAEHHLDAPWRPSDIEQREGRILRQGNLFGDKELHAPEFDPAFEVEIHTYVSERSFDAYIWQLLESKARFIQQALKGDITSREMDDADDIVLSFAEVKAVSTGNPAIMEHAKAKSDLSRLEVSESNFGKKKWRLQGQLASLPEQIEGWERREADAQTLVNAVQLPKEKDPLTLAAGGETLEGEDAASHILSMFEGLRKKGFRSVDAYHGITAEAALGRAAGVDVRGFMTSSTVSDPMTITQHWVIATGDATLSRPATIGTGAMTSLRHFLESGPRQALERAVVELKTLRGSLAAAQQEIDKPFQHAETLKALREKIKTLEGELNLDAKSQAQEAAAAGTIVTTAEEDKADAAAEVAEDGDEPEDGGDALKAITDMKRAMAENPDHPLTKRVQGGLKDFADRVTGKKGPTLQATILPGAAEFGEYVLDPAAKAIASQLKAQADDLRRLFAPDLVSEHSVRASGILRSNLAARAQRTRRAQILLRDVEKMMDGWSHEQSMDFWEVMEGQAPPSTLDADTRAIATLYREILDTKREAIKKRNLVRNYLEHYWGHEWQRGDTSIEALVRKLFGRRPLQGPESFRKHRTIPTMREGIEEHGLEPVSWNPTTQLLRKLLEMDKSIAAFDIKLELKARGEAKFVQAGKKGPKDWVRYPESFGTVYGPPTFKSITGDDVRIPFGKLVAGHYYGPAETVRLLENHLSPGLRGKSALFDLYRTAGNFLNQLQLSLSAFHFMMTGMEAIVSKQSLAFEQLARGQATEALKSQLRVPIAPFLDVVRGHKALKAFYAHDANAALIDDMVGQIVNAGGGFGWDLFEHSGAPDAFLKNLRGAAGAARGGEAGRTVTELAKAGLRVIPAVVELTAKPIMEGWVPRLKISAFLDLAAMELKTLGPEPDLEEVRRVLGAAWDSIDNRFGQLRYDNLFWNNALKDLGMGSVRALGWNIGTVREMFGMPVSQLKQLGAGGGGKPPVRMVNVGKSDEDIPLYEARPESRLHRKTAWFIAMVLCYGLAGALYMYLRTGKRPKDLRDYFFPENGALDRNGRPVRVSIAGYFKDLYHAAHDLPGSAVETATAKLHPLLTLVADVVTNEDFFGTEIRNSDDPLVEQAKDVWRYILRESLPISVQQGNVESFFGITRAPASVTRSALETYLYDIAPPTHRTQDQAQRSTERRDLRQAVRESAPGAASTVDTSHLSPADIKRTARTARRSSLEYGIQRATMKQALKAYGLATPEERLDIRAAVSKKLPGALGQTPPAERQALMDAYRAAMQLPTTTARAAGF